MADPFPLMPIKPVPSSVGGKLLRQTLLGVQILKSLQSTGSSFLENSPIASKKSALPQYHYHDWEYSKCTVCFRLHYSSSQRRIM